MPHVLLAGKLHDSGLELARSSPDITFDYVEEVSAASYRPLVARADAVLIRTQPMPAEVIAEAAKLKIVSRHGVGYDSVDVAALNKRGIPLAVVGDVNSRTVAEHAMMMMLAAAKRAIRYDRATRENGWDIRNSLEAIELSGKTLLIVGFGRIGRRLADMVRGFNMRVLVFDPFQTTDIVREAGATLVGSLAEGAAQADFVSVHAPKTSEKALIGVAELAVMKPTAIVVSTSRGGVVDEDALGDALESGMLAAAGLDVFVDEPPPPNHRLFAMDQVILSPHTAGLTLECGERMAVGALQNILDFFTGTLDPVLVPNAEAIGFGKSR